MSRYNNIWSAPEVLEAGQLAAPGVSISDGALSLAFDGAHIELAEGDTRQTAAVTQHLSASVTVPVDDILIGYHVLVTGGAGVLAGGRATVIVQVAATVRVFEFPGVFDLDKPSDGSTPQFERVFRLEFLALEGRPAAPPELTPLPIPPCLVSVTLTAQRARLAESVHVDVSGIDVIAIIERRGSGLLSFRAPPL